MSKRNLHDKVVWITGASRGIGAALAVEFAMLGARVVLSAPISEIDALTAVQHRCRDSSRHWLVPFDLSHPDDIDGAYKIVVAEAGRIDILINSASLTHRSRLLDTSPEVDRRIMEVNYFGAVALIKKVVPYMVRQGSGQVVAVSSILGLIATPYRSAYIAAKHALTGFCEALRAETAGLGIAVTLVFPGFVNADFPRDVLTGDGHVYRRKDPGQARAMTPEALARRALPGILAGEPRLIIAGRERALIYLEKVAPALLDQLVRRVAVT